MTLEPLATDDGPGGVGPLSGPEEPSPLAGGFDEDFKPPPNRTWLWIVLGIIVIAGASVGGYILYQQQQEDAELQQLLSDAPNMEPAEAAAVYRRVLQSGLHDSFRKTAAEELGNLGDTESVPLLISVITDPNELAQTAAVSVARINRGGGVSESDLGRARDQIFTQMEVAEGMGKTQFAFALALLDDPRCIEALLQGYMQDEQARNIEGLNARLVSRFASPEKLISLTLSDDSAVRMFAAQALGAKQAPSSADALVGLLNDANASVVQAAAEALAKVDSARAGPELIKLMQKRTELQDVLVKALRDTVGAPGLQPIYDNTAEWPIKLKLIQHLRAPPPPGREQPPNVPRGIGDPRAGPMCDHLYKNFEGPRELQEMGLWCLEDLGHPLAAPGLFKVASEPFDPDRENIVNQAVQSIGYYRFDGAEDFLLDMLKQGKGRPATILNALGRVGGEKLGAKIVPFTKCPDTEVTDGGACDRGIALRALGRVKWRGALKLLSDTARRHPDDVVSVSIETREVRQEFRLQDRLAAFEGLALLGDSAAAELLIATMEDTEEDPQVRLGAAMALAYCTDEEVVQSILTRIADTSLDLETRKYYVAALWHQPNAAAVSSLFDMFASESVHSGLLMAAGFALGEAGDLVDQAQLRSLLDLEDTDRLVPACLAALMAGDDETLRQLITVFETRQGVESQVRDRYAGPSGHRVFLSEALFDSGRIYRRLHNARILRDHPRGNHGWAWQHIVERMLYGNVDRPGGMHTHDVVLQLAEDLRSNENPQWRALAGVVLLRMGYRGYVLMIADEDAGTGDVARQLLTGDIE